MSPLTRRQHTRLASYIMAAARPLLPTADANGAAYRYRVESRLTQDQASIELRLVAQGSTYMDYWLFLLPASVVAGAPSFASLRRTVVGTAADTLVVNARVAWIHGEDYPPEWPNRGPVSNAPRRGSGPRQRLLLRVSWDGSGNLDAMTFLDRETHRPRLGVTRGAFDVLRAALNGKQAYDAFCATRQAIGELVLLADGNIVGRDLRGARQGSLQSDEVLRNRVRDRITQLRQQRPDLRRRDRESRDADRQADRRVAIASGASLDRLALAYGVRRELATMAIAPHAADGSPVHGVSSPPPTLPQPRSRTERLLDGGMMLEESA